MAEGAVGGVGGVGGAGGVQNLFGNLMIDMLEQTLSGNGQPLDGETKGALDTLRNALNGNQKKAASQVCPHQGAEGAGGAEGAKGAEGSKGKQQDLMGLLQMLMQLMMMVMQMLQQQQGDQGGQSPGGFNATPEATSTANQLPGGNPLSELGDGLIGLGDGLMGFANAIPA
mgnify:CR=1 FL=1